MGLQGTSPQLAMVRHLIPQREHRASPLLGGHSPQPSPKLWPARMGCYLPPTNW